MKITCILALPLLILSAPLFAETGPHMLVSRMAPAPQHNMVRVEITLLNPASAGDVRDLPNEIAAELMVDGQSIPVTLRRPHGAPIIKAAKGGFAQGEYLFTLPPGIEADKGVLSLAHEKSAPGYALQMPKNPVHTAPETGVREEVAMVEAEREATSIAATLDAPTAKPDRGNAFLGNLSSYDPIYAVYGPGTNSDGRLQISFKYQLFGDAGKVGEGAPFINGLHFGFTQRLFWDLGANSSPFRNIDFMPEVFYLVPAMPVSENLALGGQIGLRHESNGRDGDQSRSINNFYVQTMATTALGKYKLSIGPRLWFFVGDREDNPDIQRYRGNTGLFAEIGRDDGLRLTATTRLNPSSGKGSINSEISYPMDRIIDTPLNLYIFGQGFAGYGENLLDYNRKTTRFRVGIGIVR